MRRHTLQFFLLAIVTPIWVVGALTQNCPLALLGWLATCSLVAWVVGTTRTEVLTALAWLALATLTTLAALALVPRQALAQVPPEAARYRAELTRAAHSQWGLDAPVAALAAQVHQESAWNPTAVSRVGAAGLAQFMPATARWWCQREGTEPAQCLPHNPTWALRALVGYDKYLFDRAPARYTARDKMHVALRAYNGGLGHWQAEARATGLPQPTVDQVAAACGRASRHASHCSENLGYPARIMGILQPRYATWGPSL